MYASLFLKCKRHLSLLMFKVPPHDVGKTPPFKKTAMRSPRTSNDTRNKLTTMIHMGFFLCTSKILLLFNSFYSADDILKLTS